MTKQFIGTCVGNPFATVDDLCSIIDDAEEISKKIFLDACDLDEEVIDQMAEFPNSYTFWQSGEIMFFEWSRIEHFFSEVEYA